jgi:hypothetical protein
MFARCEDALEIGVGYEPFGGVLEQDTLGSSDLRGHQVGVIPQLLAEAQTSKTREELLRTHCVQTIRCEDRDGPAQTRTLLHVGPANLPRLGSAGRALREPVCFGLESPELASSRQ